MKKRAVMGRTTKKTNAVELLLIERAALMSSLCTPPVAWSVAALLDCAMEGIAELDLEDIAELDTAHGRSSVLGPVQLAPPMAGDGLLQKRDRVLTLSFWHGDHEFHAAQLPST